MEIELGGARTYVYTGGRAPDPALPAIVFIHGAQQDHSCWALQSRYFAHHGYCVLAPDLPGHCRSQGEPLDSVPAIAAWIVQLLDRMGIAGAALVGHSMGSLAALDAAAHYPSRVRALALLGSSALMPVSDALRDAMNTDPPRAMRMINLWSHARGLLGGNSVPGQWMFGSNLRLMQRGAATNLANDLSACHAYDGAAAAAQVACPTLVLMGARDQMTPPRAGRELAQRIPGAQTVTIDSAGHAMMAEQPDRVLDALKNFLACALTSRQRAA
ncbi:MAG: alpha/beta hydrolase [Rhodocyclaceae bacterium]|nr:alpha/beta hydrolase [Rhodocyclaceae bacterium]MBX3669442.1 alpha/beta hydrolase [Rhodocyclaceae bacterium]